MGKLFDVLKFYNSMSCKTLTELKACLLIDSLNNKLFLLIKLNCKCFWNLLFVCPSTLFDKLQGTVKKTPSSAMCVEHVIEFYVTLVGGRCYFKLFIFLAIKLITDYIQTHTYTHPNKHHFHTQGIGVRLFTDAVNLLVSYTLLHL